MTNFEKYKDEILPLAKNNRGFAFHMNKITDCKLSGCKNCIFTGTCIANRIKWLYEEYQEPAPKLTKDEAIFCNIVDGFIARDKDGSLALYSSEPYLENEYWFDSDTEASGTTIKSDLFPFITYKSEKYWSIEELLRLEVEE